MEDILLLTRRDLWRSPIMERQRLIYKPKKPTLQIKMLASRRTVLKTFGPYIRIIGVKMIPLDLAQGGGARTSSIGWYGGQRHRLKLI